MDSKPKGIDKEELVVLFPFWPEADYESALTEEIVKLPKMQQYFLYNAVNLLQRSSAVCTLEEVKAKPKQECCGCDKFIGYVDVSLKIEYRHGENESK